MVKGPVSFNKVLRVKKLLSNTILKNQKGIFGVGTGFLDNSCPEKGAALILCTEKEHSFETAKFISEVNKRYDIPVRINPTGPIVLFQVEGGDHIDGPEGFGTGGLVVTRTEFGPFGQPLGFFLQLLSNTHVLINPDDPTGYTEIGAIETDPLGRPTEIAPFGYVHSLAAILPPPNPNYLDVGFVTPFRQRFLSPTYNNIGTIPGYQTTYTIGDVFKKYGDTTEETFGRVDSIDFDFRAFLRGVGEFWFRNQTMLVSVRPGEQVGNHGDSGSVFLNETTNHATAVLHSGIEGGEVAFATPFIWVVQVFRILVPPFNVPFTPNRRFPLPFATPPHVRRLTETELNRIEIISPEQNPSN